MATRCNSYYMRYRARTRIYYNILLLIITRAVLLIDDF